MQPNFTIKKILLSVIPFSFIYFFKKKISVNYLLFGKSKKNIGTYLVDDNSTGLNLYSMENELGKEVISGFEASYRSYISHEGFLRKYVLEVSNCIIEPGFGWAITAKDNKLVFDSISNNSWREVYHPSYRKFKMRGGNTIDIPAIISINLIPGGESNYWHFLHDLLGQVALAKKVLNTDIPFLINKALAEKSFFKSALIQSSYLAKCTWIIRDEKYIDAGKAYFIQTMPNGNEQFFDVRNMLEVKESNKEKQRKIFLTRNKSRIRFVNNKDEIEEIARQYGFEIVDADNLSLQQQIELFGETRYLVGIHGAGLTNVLYRKNAPLHLLELLPQDYLQPHYFWISKGMGHSYSCLVGSRSSYNTSFYVDPKKFEEKLAQVLDSGV